MATPRTTFALAAAVVLGTAWMVFFETRFETTEQRAQSERRVLRVAAEDVDRIELRRQRWAETALERTGPASFRPIDPTTGREDRQAAPPEPERITRLLSVLEFLESGSRLQGEDVNEERLHSYGLSPPTFELAVVARGEEIRVALGRDLPVGDAIYLHVQGEDRVHVVDRQILEAASGLLDQVTRRESADAAPGGMR